MSTQDNSQEIYHANFPEQVSRLRSSHLGVAINNIFRSLEGLHGEQQIKLQIISNPVKASVVELPVEEPTAKIIQFPTGAMMQNELLDSSRVGVQQALAGDQANSQQLIQMEQQNDSAKAA